MCVACKQGRARGHRRGTEVIGMIGSSDVSRATGERKAAQPASRLDAALALIALSDDLQRLGYSYEAYQLREAATRLLRDSEAD